MSNNASETYAFRVVDPKGNATEQQIGGFASAAFFISSQQTSSSVIIATTMSSALGPTVISTSVASSITSANPHSVFTHVTSASNAQLILYEKASAAAETTPANKSGNAKTLGIGFGVGITIGVFGLGGGIAGYCLRRRLKRRTSTKETRNIDPETYSSRIDQFELHGIDHGTISLKEIDSNSALSGAEAERRTKVTSTTRFPNVLRLSKQHYYELED
jgi:hypothetical protein